VNRITGINHVSLLVSDTQQSLDFYHGILGLGINKDRPDGGFPGAWLDICDGQQIHLLELPANTGTARDVHGGRDRHFALDVDDLDAVIAVLEAAGIEYIASRSGRRALFCRDPDGNAIELVETTPGTTA
jgi:glyoxylase I family protein